MRVSLIDNLFLLPLPRTAHRHRYFNLPQDHRMHLGLLSLLTVLAEQGHDVRLLSPWQLLHATQGRAFVDASVVEVIADAITADAPELIGFTSLGTNFITTLRLMQAVKTRLPGVPLVLGGPHASVVDTDVIQHFAQVDVVVRGEAEATLPALVEAIGDPAKMSEIPGLTFRRGSTVVRTPDAPLITNLDALPTPAWQVVADQLGPIAHVEAGRGCPFECSFCSTSRYFGRRFRLKSTRRLIRELDQLRDTYGIRSFNLTHDNFCANRRRLLEFCDAVEGRGYAWSCSARIDLVTRPLLERMAKAGCSGLFFGVETGSQHLQQALHKRLDVSTVLPVIHAVRDLDMSVQGSFITGFPDEDAADQKQTLDLLGQTLLIPAPPTCCTFHLNLLTYHPGAPLLRDTTRQLVYDDQPTDRVFTGFSQQDHDLIRALPCIFQDHFHLVPARLPRAHHRFIVDAATFLTCLPRTTLAASLQALDCSFGDLVARLHAHAGTAAEWSARQWPDFLTAVLGLSHPLVSLARCDAAVHLQLTPPLPHCADHPTDRDAGSPLRLHPRASILPELHDYRALRAALDAGENISDPLASQRQDHLLFYSNNGAGPGVQLRPLSTTQSRLLSMLRDGAVPAEAVESLALDPGSRRRLRRFLLRLKHYSVLVAAAPGVTQAMPHLTPAADSPRTNSVVVGTTR